MGSKEDVWQRDQTAVGLSRDRGNNLLDPGDVMNRTGF
jgi:hypothetical protein